MHMVVRLKRIFAFIIDWNITLIPTAIIFSFVFTFMKNTQINYLFAILCILIVFSTFGIFILRDVIFKGRSLGKRIFGLYIYEKYSLQSPNIKQCFLRNIFLFIYPVDGIVLLASGETIGDRVTNTVVLTKNSLENYSGNQYQTFPATTICAVPKKKRSSIILIFAIVMVCVLVFIGFIQLILNNLKNTPEFEVAYNYFVESETFKKLNVDESKIKMNRYNSKTYTSADNKSSQTVEIGFFCGI